MKSIKYKNLEEILPNLPRHSYSVRNIQMEPVCLIAFGGKRQIKKLFGGAGWYLADSINTISSIRSLLSTVFNSSYKKGPMWPSYVNSKMHQLGFEKPTRSDTYRRRHHLRLWKTDYKLGRKRLWIGTISYDRSVGHYKNSLLPTHHISPTLNLEEDFLARTFDIKNPVYVRLSQPEEGVINTGDNYVWDGRALVVNAP